MIELVTLAEIKEHLHIDHDADDGPLKEKNTGSKFGVAGFYPGKPGQDR